MAETYCRACGTAESERQIALKAGKVNCCPERSVNEVIEVRHGVPATTAGIAVAESQTGGRL